MSPLAPPVPSLWALPNPTAVMATDGPVPETEMDKGGSSSQQTTVLPVQGVATEEEKSVSLLKSVNDEMKPVVGNTTKGMKSVVANVQEGVKGTGKEKENENIADAIHALVQDNATPSPAEDSGTNTASVFPVVHQSFRPPRLLVPPSFASRANQDTVDRVSKPGVLFSTPPPPDSLSCGKPSGQLSPFGVYNDSPASGSVPPSQSGSGSVLFRKSFAPPSSIVASNGVTSQASKAGETSGVASTSSPFSLFARTSSPRSSTNVQSTLQPSPLGSISSSGPNTFTSDRFGAPRFANVNFDRNCPTVTSDGMKKDKVKTEEVEDDALVSAHRPDLMAVIPSTVKKRLLQSEIVHLQSVQRRIDAAKDANSKGLFAEIPASVTLTKNEFREIRNIQSKIVQSTICNDEPELPSAKRQRFNDDGMGKDTILNGVPCYPGVNFSIPSNAMAKGKGAVNRPSGVNGPLDTLPASICDVAVWIWADFI
jgi:hypothetical protein